MPPVVFTIVATRKDLWTSTPQQVVVIGSLKAFDMIYVLTNGGPAHMTEVPSSLMFSSIFNLNKYGYGSAISIFIVVECIVMAVILQKVFLVKEESA